ncbi:MAG TPA: class I SAM-dependent methyltransferase [Stenomitos sp.]
MLTNENIESLPRNKNLSQTQAMCPSCGNKDLSIFYEIDKVPVHSCLMLSSEQEASDFPSDSIALGVCNQCGFITNTQFDSKWSAYASNYEDQQSFSPTFNGFARQLAQGLVDKYDLYEKDIVEIGCSKGDFLLLLCELGNNRGVGIDPSVVPGRVPSEAANRVKFIQEYYSISHSKFVGDFICCRHTLEHIHLTYEFVQTIRASIGDRLNTSVFFEIPDTTRVLKDLSFEDIYYEHCSYFTPGSLARLFRLCNFEVIDLYRAYNDQYLLIEVLPVETTSNKVHPLEESLDELQQFVESFTEQIHQKLEYWRRHLSQMYAQGKKVVIWGSGSKCVAFLTTLGMYDEVQYIVDINPYRHGKFIPGVAKEIVSPEFLRVCKPDQIIVMNSIYCLEIQAMLTDMGVEAEVVSI